MDLGSTIMGLGAKIKDLDLQVKDLGPFGLWLLKSAARIWLRF